MKIADAKKVADLIEKYNGLAANLSLVNGGEVMICFGDASAPRRDWFALAATAVVAKDLRERIGNQLILDMEKLKEQMAALGVEL